MARLNRKAFRALREQIDWIVTGNRFFGSSSDIVIHSEKPKRGPRKQKSFDIYRCIPNVVFGGIRDTSRSMDTLKSDVGLGSIILFTEKGPING